MVQKTLYITDLDGTLLNRDKEVTGFTREILNTFLSTGGYFTIATARTVASAEKILSGVHLEIPAVLMNGAAIYDFHSRKYVRTAVIPTDTVREMLEVIRSFNVSGFMYTIRGDTLVTYFEHLETKSAKDFHDERVQKYGKYFEQVESFGDVLAISDSRSEDAAARGDTLSDSDPLPARVIYFVLTEAYEVLHEVQLALKSLAGLDMILYKDIYEQDLWYLEIYSPEASKYNAAAFLRELGAYERVIGFGDNHNDLPLLKACDEFYSVSNAVEELKGLSTGIIGSNLEDGVVRFLAEREGIRLPGSE